MLDLTSPNEIFQLSKFMEVCLPKLNRIAPKSTKYLQMKHFLMTIDDAKLNYMKL